MIKKFIEIYTKKIVNRPESIKVLSQIVAEEDGSQTNEISILAHPDDIGRLIGKEGKMIGSLKTLISGAKAKDGQNYRISIQSSK